MPEEEEIKTKILKELAEKAAANAELLLESRATSEERGAAYDALFVELKENLATLQERAEAAEKKNTEQSEKLKQIEADALRSINDIPAPITAGRLVTSSEQYANSSSTRMDEVSIPNHFKAASGVVTIGDPNSAGALEDPEFIPGIWRRPDRTVHMRDIMGSAITSENTIEYVIERNFFYLYAESNAAILAAATTVTVDNGYGFYDGQAISIANNDGSTPEPVVISGISFTDSDSTTDFSATLTFAPAISVGKTDAAQVTSQTYTYTPECKLKPRALPDLEKSTCKMTTLASWVHATRQALAHAPMMERYINERLPESILRSEDRVLLYGDGVDEPLGFMIDPSTQSYTTATTNRFTEIRRAKCLAELFEYMPDAIVMHPNDICELDLQVGSDGHYIRGVDFEAGNATVWSLRVVTMSALAEGDFIIGSFGANSTIWESEATTIRVGDQHADNFTKNLVTILAENRICKVVELPEAFVKGTFM